MTFFDGAQLEVSVAFGKGAGESVVDGDYTDITADVRDGIRINRGRGSEFDTFTTGTLQLVLDNRSRDYDPENTSGPHYGDLLPMRHIRVRVTYDSVTAYLFKGYVRSWEQGWELSDHDATCVITADDGFKILAQTALPESIWATEVLADLPEAWYRLGEANGAAFAEDSSGNERVGFYTGNVSSVTTAGLIEFSGDAGRLVTPVPSPGTSLPPAAGVDPPVIVGGAGTAYLVGTTFSFECWFTFASSSGSVHSSQIFGQWNDARTKYFGFQVNRQLSGNGWALNVMAHDGTTSFSATYDVVGSDQAGDTPQHFVFTRSSTTWKMYHNGAEVTPGTSSGSFALAGFDYGSYGFIRGTASFTGTFTIDEVALYSSALSAARVLAHYTAGATAYAGDTVDERITRVIEATGLLTAFDLATDASVLTVQGCDFADGATTALAYLQNLEQYEDGRLFFAADGTLTFHSRYHDAGQTVAYAFSDETTTDYPYRALAPRYDDSRIYNDVTVARTGGVAQRATDATSKTSFGARSLNLTGLPAEADAESASLAAGYVAKFKDPLLRFEAITVRPMARPATLMPVVSDTEIGYRVSVRRHPVRSGSAYTKELSVEGIGHRITVGGEWESEYLTAPSDVSDSWLVLDDSSLGLLDTGRVGY